MTTFLPVRLTLTHSLRLHIAFSHEKSHFLCFVLEGEEGEILRLTERPGDLQLGGVDDWLTFLPGDVLAVVVTRPDLLSVLDLPEAGAVLLGHVLTVVLGLVVLHPLLLDLAPREVLHLHHRHGLVDPLLHPGICTGFHQLALEKTKTAIRVDGLRE